MFLNSAHSWGLLLLWCIPTAPDVGPPKGASQRIEARDLLMEGSYERAATLYKKLIDDDPNHAAAARLGLARCRLQRGRYDAAIQELVDSPAQASSDWHYLLARLYDRTGRYDDVLAHARQAIQLDGRHAGARLLLGQTLEKLGRREEALQAYRWFDRQVVTHAELPRDADRITHTALGFLRYSVLTQTNIAQRTKHVLNEMLQVAYERLDRSYWPARIAAADLLRERFNNSEEDGSLSDYRAALRVNRNLPQAQVGIGEVWLEGWQFEAVEKQVEEALRINPHYAPALHLLAKKFLLERRYDQAFDTCRRALGVNARDLVALSLAAAAKACQYDEEGMRRMVDRVTAINPRCALLHRILADALAGLRQFDASQREYLQAVKLDPTSANARTELGMMYMQWGEEDKARNALEAAWALDPFNERTKFTLDLLDVLAQFAHVETKHFVVKYNAQRDPGFGEFVAGFVEDIYDTVTADYDTKPSVKTIIELFPTRRAFGVRITGKPWIHTIGASTGRVIALASPHDKAHLEPYNLPRVLLHEFTHTVTLEATHNRIPHWFTEGLAVYQEEAPRSFAWRQRLADAARRDRFFTLESIDWGFIRPRRVGDRQLAYAQSEWMCEYIVERFGYDIINRMLQAFRRGQTQHEVFVEQLGIRPDDFDQQFGSWARTHIKQWGFDLTAPEDAAVLRLMASSKSATAKTFGRLARAEFDQGNADAALKAARRAIELDKQELNGLRVLVQVLALRTRAAGDDEVIHALDEQAKPALEQLLVLDPKGWQAPKYLAGVVLRQGDSDRAIELNQRLQRLCPIDPASWQALSGIYLERGEVDLALPQLLELARLGGDDSKVDERIARIYQHRGRLREAQYWFRQALGIDPFNVELHQAQGDTCMRAGQPHAALQEYLILTKLEPTVARHFTNAALTAHKLGLEDQARTLARQAVELDPTSVARTLLP